MHLTISGYGTMDQGKNKARGFSSWVVITEIKDQEFNGETGEIMVIMGNELNLESTNPEVPFRTLE